jgi:hypothetical protein
MDSVDLERFWIGERTRSNHRARSAQILLARLKNQLQRAVHVGATGGQDLGDPDRDRNRNVVPADVRGTRPAGSEGHVGALGLGDSVELGAIRDDRSGPGAAQNRHDPMTTNTCADFETQLAHLLANQSRRLTLLTCQLRILVDLPAQGDQPGLVQA